MSESPAERFEALAAGYRNDPRVSEGTGFGSSAGLRVDAKIFAMLMGDRLVLKLPAHRVQELLGEGAAPFGTAGRAPMKEWVSVPAGMGDWRQLAQEAYDFVGS